MLSEGWAERWSSFFSCHDIHVTLQVLLCFLKLCGTFWAFSFAPMLPHQKKAFQPTRRYSAGSLTALSNIIELNSSIRFKKKSNSDIFFSADVLKWPRRTEFLEGEAKTNCAPNYKPSGAQNGGVSDSEHSPQIPEEGSPRATISSSLIMLCRHPWPDRRGHDLRARLDKHLLAHPLLFYSVLQGKLFNDFFC